MLRQLLANLACIEFHDNQVKVFKFIRAYRRTDGQNYINVHCGGCEHSYHVKQHNSFEKISNILQIWKILRQHNYIEWKLNNKNVVSLL
jgi:hypothetical protein